MPYKNAQSAPAATTETDLYTVPAGKEVVISTLSVCNRGSTLATCRVMIVKGGGATVDANYIYKDTRVYPNDNLSRTTGDVMMAGDILRVYSSNGNLSFTFSFREKDIS